MTEWFSELRQRGKECYLTNIDELERTYTGLGEQINEPGYNS